MYYHFSIIVLRFMNIIELAGSQVVSRDFLRSKKWQLHVSMQYSLFGSILTFGAMVGAITSGPIADFVGRKGVNSFLQLVSALIICFMELDMF